MAGICYFRIPGRRGTKAAGSLQKLVYIYRHTRCHIPEGITVNIYLPENLKNVNLLKLFMKS